jgi:hypothetical protein
MGFTSDVVDRVRGSGSGCVWAGAGAFPPDRWGKWLGRMLRAGKGAEEVPAANATVRDLLGMPGVKPSPNSADPQTTDRQIPICDQDGAAPVRVVRVKRPLQARRFR